MANTTAICNNGTQMMTVQFKLPSIAFQGLYIFRGQNRIEQFNCSLNIVPKTLKTLRKKVVVLGKILFNNLYKIKAKYLLVGY